LPDEVLDEAYKELSVAMDQSIDSIKQFHNNYKDAYEVFRQKTLEKQAIQRIKENSDIERVEAERVTSQDGESESEETETTSKPG
jgi:hypothetical protein